MRSVQEQIGGACVTVVRNAYASAVGDSDSAEVANKRRVDVPVNCYRRTQNAVDGFEFGVRWSIEQTPAESRRLQARQQIKQKPKRREHRLLQTMRPKERRAGVRKRVGAVVER